MMSVMANKKLLLSLLLIVVTIAGGIGASRALFSDTEVGTGSQFTMGTLELDVDGNSGDQTAFDKFEVDNIGADGTISGGKTWVANNRGSLPGRISFFIDNIINYENGCNPPEALVDDTCDDPGPGQGELGQVLSTEVYLDTGNGPELMVSSDLDESSQDSYAQQWADNGGNVVVPPGGSVEITMNWETNPGDYGNEVQGDSLTFDIGFSLEQVAPTP